MLGMLCRQDRRWGGVRLEQGQVLGLPVLQACIPRRERGENRQLKHGGRFLRRAGVRYVLPERDVQVRQVLKEQGLTPVDGLPLYRAMAADLVMASLERGRTAPERATVCLRGELAGGDLWRTAQLLCPRVRELVIDTRTGAEELADQLYRQFGAAVCVGKGKRAQTTVCFDGPPEEGELGLGRGTVQLLGMTVTLREGEIPEQLEPGGVLCALWQNGRLPLNCLQVTF